MIFPQDNNSPTDSYQLLSCQGNEIARSCESPQWHIRNKTIVDGSPGPYPVNSAQECLKSCISSPTCVGVEVTYRKRTKTIECWAHTNTSDYWDHNMHLQHPGPRTDSYQLLSCQGDVIARACESPEWRIRKKTRVDGSPRQYPVISAKECMNSCASSPTCVGVDVTRVKGGIQCWAHTKESDYQDHNIRPQDDNNPTDSYQLLGCTDCVNKHGDHYCAMLAVRDRYCKRQPYYMSRACYKACSRCDLISVDCNPTEGGRRYMGDKDVTVNGYTCQAWSSQSPHEHPYNKSYMFPDTTVNAASNHCRNPAEEYGYIGLWCFTTNAGKRWDICNVPRCRGNSTGKPFSGPCQNESLCLNGGTCFHLIPLGRDYCHCTAGFHGPRCADKPSDDDIPGANMKIALLFHLVMTLMIVVNCEDDQSTGLWSTDDWRR